MQTIYLPTEDEISIKINVPRKGKSPKEVVVNLLSLETEFVQAQRNAKQMDVHWSEEFVHLAKDRFDMDISADQAILLWNAVNTQITEVKKKLQGSSETSSTTVSKSPRKRKKK